MFQFAKDYLIKIHNIFDELGYIFEDKDLSFNDFFSFGIKKLNRSYEFEDSIEIIKLMKVIIKDFSKIKDLIKNNFDFWKNIPFKNKKLEFDEEFLSSFYLTNAFYNYKNICITNFLFQDEKTYEVIPSYGRYSFKKNNNYSLKFSLWSRNKMYILDKYDNKLCSISLDKEFNICLKDNKTNFILIPCESGLAIYDKNYINQLNGKKLDENEMFGFILWDVIFAKENNRDCLARLDIYNINSDIELFLLLAMSSIILYNSYITSRDTLKFAIIYNFMNR